MLTFIKENSYTIVKLMVNQFGMTVFGIMLYLVTQNNQTLVLITSCFAVLMYMFLLHTVVWEEGAKLRIRSDAGRAELKPLGGLVLSLCASIPNIIIAIVVIIGAVVDNGGVLHTIGKAVGYLWEGMYMGFIALYSPFNPIAFALIVLPEIFVVTLSYYLGTRNFSLRGLLKLNQPANTKSISKSKPKQK